LTIGSVLGDLQSLIEKRGVYLPLQDTSAVPTFGYLLPLIIHTLIINTVFKISVYCIILYWAFPMAHTTGYVEVRSPPIGFGMDNLPYSV